MFRRIVCRMDGMLLLALSLRPVLSEPSHTVIIPFAAGAAPIVGRFMGSPFGARTGQRLIIENRGGISITGTMSRSAAGWIHGAADEQLIRGQPVTAAPAYDAFVT